MDNTNPNSLDFCLRCIIEIVENPIFASLRVYAIKFATVLATLPNMYKMYILSIIMVTRAMQTHLK